MRQRKITLTVQKVVFFSAALTLVAHHLAQFAIVRACPQEKKSANFGFTIRSIEKATPVPHAPFEFQICLSPFLHALFPARLPNFQLFSVADRFSLIACHNNPPIVSCFLPAAVSKPVVFLQSLCSKQLPSGKWGLLES